MRKRIEAFRKKILKDRNPSLEEEIRSMGAGLFELYNSGLNSVQLQMLWFELAGIIYSKHGAEV